MRWFCKGFRGLLVWESPLCGLGMPSRVERAEQLCKQAVSPFNDFPSMMMMMTMILNLAAKRFLDSTGWTQACCVGRSTHAEAQRKLKERWIAAGRPEDPDWDALLEGL